MYCPIQDINLRRTSAQYLAAIKLHAERNKESFLYPGVNYRFLSRFLTRSTQEHTSKNDSLLLPHKFACVHTFKNDGRRELDGFDDNNLVSFLHNEKPDPNHGSLVFLRGFPSPSWMTETGAFYKVDPEFSRRHLDFLKLKNYHDLPGLQSDSRNSVQLNITTICTRSSAINRDQVLLARKEEYEEVVKHQKKLGLTGIVGESIIRKYSVHNETTFTIEQSISCHIKISKGPNSGWTGT